MKYFMILVGLVLAWNVAADPRVEVNSNNTFCHILHGNLGNADDETFDGACEPFVAANGVGGADAFGRSVRYGVPAAVVKHVFNYGREVTVQPCPPGQEKKGRCDTKWVVRLTQNDYPGLQCAIVDSNNKQYNAATWRIRIVWLSDDPPPQVNGRLVNEIICLNGQ